MKVKKRKSKRKWSESSREKADEEIFLAARTVTGEWMQKWEENRETMSNSLSAMAIVWINVIVMQFILIS